MSEGAQDPSMKNKNLRNTGQKEMMSKGRELVKCGKQLILITAYGANCPWKQSQGEVTSDETDRLCLIQTRAS